MPVEKNYIILKRQENKDEDQRVVGEDGKTIAESLSILGFARYNRKV